MCHAIQTGKVDDSLVHVIPGPLVHSRFLTTALRVLRYHISIDHPSDKLMNIVNFIIKVYAPIWFEIRKNQSFKMGPKIIFKYI